VTGPALILVGPPGSGKSTVGRMAAEHLGLEFRDFDDDIERVHTAVSAATIPTSERTPEDVLADVLATMPVSR
jgi:shikimate kinase